MSVVHPYRLARGALSLLVVVASLGAPGLSFGQEDVDDLVSPLLPPAKAKPKAPKRRKASEPAAPEIDTLEPLVPLSGTLVVELPPGVDSAVLFIDGNQAGTLPAEPRTILSGEHLIEVRRRGCADFSQRVTVSGGKQTTVKAQLQPVSGDLIVESNVPGAEVFVDGVLSGETPIDGLLLAPGPHEIVVRREGFETFRERVIVAAGGRHIVSANLTRSADNLLAPSRSSPAWVPTVGAAPRAASPIYTRWEFWAAAGGAVVAGFLVYGATQLFHDDPVEEGLRECKADFDTCEAFTFGAGSAALTSGPPLRF